jgi:hypothetical protein
VDRNSEGAPPLADFARSGTTKDVAGNEPGSEDQDSGRGKDVINWNPTSPKTREKWGTLSLFIDEMWATQATLSSLHQREVGHPPNYKTKNVWFSSYGL